MARRIRIVLPGEPLLDDPTALRPWRDSDIPELVQACQDPEIVRWTRVPPRYGESEARAYLLARYDAIAAGASAPFAIVQATDGPLLGSISLMRFAHQHARAEVGYWLWRPGPGPGAAGPRGAPDLRLGLPLARTGAHRSARRDGQRRLPARSRAGRLHARGTAALLHAGHLRAPGYGRLRAAGLRSRSLIGLRRRSKRAHAPTVLGVDQLDRVQRRALPARSGERHRRSALARDLDPGHAQRRILNALHEDFHRRLTAEARAGQALQQRRRQHLLTQRLVVAAGCRLGELLHLGLDLLTRAGAAAGQRAREHHDHDPRCGPHGGRG